MNNLDLAMAAYEAYSRITNRWSYVHWEELPTLERQGWFTVVAVVGEKFKQAREADPLGRMVVRRDERDPWEGQENAVFSR